MVLPVDLCSDHHLAWTRSIGEDPAALLGIAGTILLCTVVGLGLFRARTRVLCALLALILGHLMLRFAFPIFELFVEYRAYPSMTWLGILAGLGFGFLFIWKKKPAMWAAFALITASTTMSAMRSAVWSDGAAISRHASARYPLNNRPRTQLQAAAYRSGNYQEVIRLDQEIRGAYQQLTAYNQGNSQSRELDPNRAITDLIVCEQLTTLALAEIHDSKAAIKFANERIAHYEKELSLDKLDDYEKALESLLEARDVLEEHGAEYDRRKKERANAQASRN